MDSHRLTIGILIPTYQHDQTVRQVISDCLQYLPHILVVIDGAADRTQEKIQDLPITIVEFPQNQGKGAALKAGFLEAQRLGWDYVITMDSDGQHLARNLPDFFAAIANNPGKIIIGDRDMSSPQIPDSSKFGKKFTNFWLWIETGCQVADGQSGFRAYPVRPINRVKTWCNRYEFEVEILARAIWAGIEITSIPVAVDYCPPGGRVSHFRPFMDNLRTSMLNTLLVLTCLPHLLRLWIKKLF